MNKSEIKEEISKIIDKSYEEEFEYERNRIKDYLGQELYDELKECKAIVAGGMITSIFTRRDINDVDIYFKSNEDAFNFMVQREGDYIRSETDKAMLFQDTESGLWLQCIYFDFFKNAEEIFKCFDFTVCMGAFDFESEKFILHRDFLKHNAQRILKFNSQTKFPLISALRIEKYKNKGYKISKPEYIKLMLTVNKLNINSLEEFKKQTGGMYGERFNLLFDEKEFENKEFNIETAIKLLDKIEEVDLDKCKRENSYQFKDYATHLCKILGVKIPYTKFDDWTYQKKGNYIKQFNYESLSDEEKAMYKNVLAEDFIKLPIKRYKVVKKKSDGTLVSYYKYQNGYSDFQYKIGERVEAESDTDGIYTCESIDKARRHSFYSNSDAVIIEVEIEKIDDIKWLNDLETVKAVKVIRIVEEKALLAC